MAILSEPANELETTALPKMLPVLIVRDVPTIAAALKPLVTVSDPPNDDEPVPLETMLPPLTIRPLVVILPFVSKLPPKLNEAIV